MRGSPRSRASLVAILLNSEGLILVAFSEIRLIGFLVVTEGQYCVSQSWRGLEGDDELFELQLRRRVASGTFTM